MAWSTRQSQASRSAAVSGRRSSGNVTVDGAQPSVGVGTTAPRRRVGGPALDNLNRIDQGQRWRGEGVLPRPTDGRGPSKVALPEDRLPTTAGELHAPV